MLCRVDLQPAIDGLLADGTKELVVYRAFFGRCGLNAKREGGKDGRGESLKSGIVLQVR